MLTNETLILFTCIFNGFRFDFLFFSFFFCCINQIQYIGKNMQIFLSLCKKINLFVKKPDFECLKSCMKMFFEH